MSALPFSQKDYQFLLQGIKALEKDCATAKVALAEKIFPQDNNLHTLLEYYDKRAKELHDVKSKILGVST